VVRISGGAFPRERVRAILGSRDPISLSSGLAVFEIAPCVYTRDALSDRGKVQMPCQQG
jgi:hypothetical protein